MPTLTQLEYIVAVHKTKHFGRAAQDCFVSQPSLSAQIQKAEEELGLTIFDRSKKRVLTTSKGLEVIQQAQAILREHGKLFEIAKEKGRLNGKFHLAIIPTLAAYVLPLFLERFSSQNPDVDLKISEMKTEDIIRALQDDSIDGALVVTPLQTENFVERVLFHEPFFVFASQNHALLKKKSVRNSDLDMQSIWLLEEGHCFRSQVLNVCGLKGEYSVLPNVEFESGHLETLIQLIRNGRGYTLLPELATHSLSAQEKKTQLRTFAQPAPSREVSLVSSRTHYKEDILNGLYETLYQQIPEHLKKLKTQQVSRVPIS